MQKLTSFVAHDNYVLVLRFTDDNRTLVSAGMDNVIKLWSTVDWKLQQSVSSLR